STHSNELWNPTTTGPKLKGWSHGTPTMPRGVVQNAILVGSSVLLALQLTWQASKLNASPLPSPVTKQPSSNLTSHCTPFVSHATHGLDRRIFDVTLEELEAAIEEIRGPNGDDAIPLRQTITDLGIEDPECRVAGGRTLLLFELHLLIDVRDTRVRAEAGRMEETQSQ